MYKTKNMVVYVQFALCVSLALLVQNASGLSVNGPTPKVTFNVTGLMPAVFTSLNDDQSVNLEVIPLYADYLVSKGVRAILVGGTSGEHVSLSVSDRRELITAWVKAVDARMHVQVQVGGAPFPDVIALAKHSAEVGADSIITLPDVYSRPQTVGDLVSYVGMVARAVPNLPVFYYHIPAITNVVLNMPQFVRVATTSIPNFMGLKFTSSDLVEAAEILKVLADGQQLLLGGERLVAPGSLLGIRTFVSPGDNIYPGLMQGVLDAAQGGDIQRARTLQNTLTTVIDAISNQGGRIPALKMALERRTGLKVGPPALPKRPVTVENRMEIGDILRRVQDHS